MAKKVKFEKFQFPIPFRRTNTAIIVEVKHVHKTSNQFGRAMGRLVCPCCDADVDFYIWSMAGGGKRCPNCAVLLSFRNAFIFNEEVPEGLKMDENVILGYSKT